MLIPILFCVSSLVFFLLHAIPGDPVDFILGEQALPTEREMIRQDLGLDKPILSQYKSYMSGIVHGEWGNSLFDRRKVLAHIEDRYGATVQLALLAMFFAIFLAIPIGVFAALQKYSIRDNLAMFVSLIGISIPNFWLGPLLILLFSVHLGWLPVAGRESFWGIVLPSITLGTAMSALLSRITRASMLEVLEKEYVNTARAKGLSEWRVIWKHALRNALNPVVTIVGLQVGTLLAGAIVTEKIFSWPGIGSLLIESIMRRDYPLVQGCILVIAFTYVAVNMLTDCVYRLVDPRIRLR